MSAAPSPGGSAEPANQGMGAGSAEFVAATVIDLLRTAGSSVATAESLTGGLVCAALTEVPGASAVVRGGVVSYAVEVKKQVLGVPTSVLAEHGAVSPQCAEAMAVGARRVLGAGWAVATTGVAGPDPSEAKPVGTVHIAVAGEHGVAQEALHLYGSRAQIREATVTAVLRLLHDTLSRGLSDGQGTVGHLTTPPDEMA